jgi:hypothetical protein
MNRIASLAWLEIYTRRKRIGALIAFGLLYLVAGIAVRAIGTGDHGQVEPDKLMEVGGYPLISAFLLTGWSIGRYPLAITLVMIAGIISGDVTAGYARIFAATRVRLLALYGARLGMLMLVSFSISAVLLPAFDYIILGKLSGVQLYVLIAGYILVFGTLTALFSVLTRADAWCALFVWIVAIVWHSLLRAGMLARVPSVISQLVSVLLPPMGALSSLENAFGASQAIPWGAFLYVCMYSVLVLLLAGLLFSRREI